MRNALQRYGIRDFNPRPREGSDAILRLSLSGWQISIHAPARGATLSVPAYAYPRGNFNPRPREGSDISLLCRSSYVRYFNPRPREGSDRIYLPLCNHKPDFNPRPREGSDASGILQEDATIIFQSTPPRGERP